MTNKKIYEIEMETSSYILNNQEFPIYGTGKMAKINAVIDGFYRINRMEKIVKLSNYSENPKDLQIYKDLELLIKEYNKNKFKGSLSSVEDPDEQEKIKILANIYQQNFEVNPYSVLHLLPKDPLYMIALELDLESLLSLCLTNVRLSKICKDDTFWQARTFKYYFDEAEEKPFEMSWKDYHKRLGGKLFMFGKNYYGQLGNKSNKNSDLPVKINLGNIHIYEVSCGLHHTGVVTVDGKLFMFGSNESGQLGYTGDNTNIPVSWFFETRNKVRSVSCGDYHTAIITKDNRLFMVGKNNYGQLGIKPDQFGSRHEIPIELKEFSNNVYAASCGFGYTGVVTKDGKLFMFGKNNRGQLGTQNPERDNPTEIKLFGNKIHNVSCGGFHTGVVTKNNRLFMFGASSSGQLINEYEPGEIYEPIEVKSFEGNVSKVSCGYLHTGVVTKNGQLFMYGDGKSGQLGTKYGGFVKSLGNDVDNVSCGTQFTGVVTKDEKLFMFGTNYDGQLGTGNHGPGSNIYTPTEIKQLKNVKMVSCGNYHTGVIANIK